MKKIKRVTVVEGNPSEVRNEILLKKNNATGKIDLLKRDSSGTLKSIMDNHLDFLVDPEKGPIYLIDPITGESSEFMSAFENLTIAMGTSSTLVKPYDTTAEAVVELTEQVQHDIETIAAYLPSGANTDFMFKCPNIINVFGMAVLGDEDPANNFINVCVQNQLLAISFLSKTQAKLQMLAPSI